MIKLILKLIVCIILITLSFTTNSINDQPVIGILTIPSDFSNYPSTNYSYFGASYVKYIES